MQLDAYLHFSGQCREAFKFYEQTLGGKIEFIMTYGESPAAAQSSPEFKEKVIHARMKIGERFLMGMDAPPDRFHKPQGFTISIGVKTVAESEQVFKLLSEGGQVTMPLQKTFWSLSFAMLVDRYGIPWMINCEQAA